ncbi:MAG TPA: DUF4238 domain-containing protein [Clostridia bacterium]|nr:DUF4238 domain-containing protein [Clostridia bacterium]
MPPYKRQHYLPAGYLKFFATDLDGCTRDAAQIWRCDGKEQRLVPVKTQCSKDYHYSKENPGGAEKEFHLSEDRYCKCVTAFKTGKEPDDDRETGAFLMSMFTLYLRNAVHINKSGREGIEAYRRRFWTFLQRVLLVNYSEANSETLQAEMSNNWGLRIFAPPDQRLFITSDNPSIWTCVFGDLGCGPASSIRSVGPSLLQIVALPITPLHMAVAYDKTAIHLVSDKLSEEDYRTLNNAQLRNANECIYASSPLPPDLSANIGESIRGRARLRPETTAETCTLQVNVLEPEFHFSFVARTPPRM